ncbi:hypothetical protein JB92DRAFT_3050070 [Gautieria morchelliformis]|nr:hypothetical protein JB92DRAFT_3050070 [Gautieria morchelliformis]
MQGEVIPKILKPKGTGGRDFNIWKHMGLDPKDEGDKATYKDVMLWSNKKLDICQSLHHQESQMITLVEVKVLEECPKLRHFQDNWPIKALIRQYLKNSSEQYRQRLQNQEEAEVEIAPPTPIVAQTAAKSCACAKSTTVSTKSSSASASSSTATTKSVSCVKSTTAAAKSSTAVAKSVIAAKTTTAGTKLVAPAKASAAKSKLTAKSTVAPKPQAIIKPTTEPKLSITTMANSVTKKQKTKALVPAEAKSTLVKKKAKPTPLFNATSSNKDLADPALEMLGFDSPGPKSKVVKGKKKKTSKAENPVIQDITGSNENSNKHKRPAADVENLELPAKRAKLAVKLFLYAIGSSFFHTQGIPQSKKAMLANKQKVPKVNLSH